MTGYGRGETASVDKQITLEVKSVNHRFLEIVVRMPRQLSALEERIKKTVQDRVSRGRIDIFVSLEETGEKKRLVKVDKELGLAYYNSLKELANSLEIPENFDIVRMSTLPGLLTIETEEDNIEEIWQMVQAALTKALDSLIEMRTVEGEKLATDLLNRRNIIADYVARIEERSSIVVSEYKEKLSQRVQELLGDIQIDEQKLANEVAFFADRASIAEELVRLESHLSQMIDIVKSNNSVGRKLDFLVQEMNREINTIGSKANDIEISHAVVEVKSELEKVREQVQNIE